MNKYLHGSCGFSALALSEVGSLTVRELHSSYLWYAPLFVFPGAALLGVSRIKTQEGAVCVWPASDAVRKPWKRDHSRRVVSHGIGKERFRSAARDLRQIARADAGHRLGTRILEIRPSPGWRTSLVGARAQNPTSPMRLILLVENWTENDGREENWSGCADVHIPAHSMAFDSL
ncbi:hypothetical protein C8R45DRAFT_1075565 [Mycena sanguinolenta]|nr:hypothetical protein C8R45DRAFT_1075565 [Mycena sanguinolenta]